MRTTCFALLALAAGFAGGAASNVSATARDREAKTQAADGFYVGGHKSGEPSIGVYSEPGSGYAAVAFNRSADDTCKNNAAGFGIATDKAGAYFQVVDADGKAHVIPVTALLKLEGK